MAADEELQAPNTSIDLSAAVAAEFCATGSSPLVDSLSQPHASSHLPSELPQTPCSSPTSSTQHADGECAQLALRLYRAHFESSICERLKITVGDKSVFVSILSARIFRYVANPLQVPRCMMIMESGAIRQKLSCKFREAEMLLDQLNPRMLEPIVNFVKFDQLDMETVNVCELYKAATQLEMDSLKVRLIHLNCFCI